MTTDTSQVSQQEVNELKDQLQKDLEDRKSIYDAITTNPTLDSLAEHIVHLYNADAQSMKSEIINGAMFKTFVDIFISKGLTTAEDFDNQLSDNLKMIENAYQEQYDKFEALMNELDDGA